MSDDREIDAAFRAGFRAGFESSREGFNGECAYDALAPPFYRTGVAANADALHTLEDMALAAFTAGTYEQFMNSLRDDYRHRQSSDGQSSGSSVKRKIER
jgi:hypothetical protein